LHTHRTVLTCDDGRIYCVEHSVWIRCVNIANATQCLPHSNFNTATELDLGTH
jgi:hypothetical protein